MPTVHADPEELLLGIEDRAGLSHTDGNPLYAYRATKHEVQSLVHSLRSRLDGITPSRPGCCAALCLLAAESFCREYEGGPWSWMPLWRALGTEKDVQWLYPVVRKGLQWWKREVFRLDNSVRYLATIALEGGLPRQVFGREDARVTRYLRRALREYERAPTIDVALLAEELGCELPRSLRQPVLFELVARLVQELSTLRQQLPQDVDPIDYLEVHVPQWRKGLPLRLEDDSAARALLTGLLRQSRDKADGTEADWALVLELDTSPKTSACPT